MERSNLDIALWFLAYTMTFVGLWIFYKILRKWALREKSWK